MDKEKAAQRVREIIAERLNRKAEDMTDGVRIEEDLGADSLDKGEIILTLEEEFSMDIDDEANDIKTVGDAVKYIQSRLG
jgi:acyl carrier protein